MKYREASKKLKLLGGEELPGRGAGSHRVWHNPEKQDCSFAGLRLK